MPVTNGVPRSAFFRGNRTGTSATWAWWYSAALVFGDFAAIALASFATISWIPQAASGFVVDPEAPTPAWFYIVAYLFLPLGWVLVLWGHGAYDRRYLGVGSDESKRVLRAFWTAVAVVSFTVMSTKTDASRMSVGVVLLLGLILLLIARVLARRVLYSLRARGRCVQRVLLVGALPEALEVHTVISRNVEAGMAPVGLYLTEGYGAARGVETPVPVYANRDLVELVRELGADTIAVCGAAGADSADLRRLAWQLEGTGIDLVVAPQLTDIAGPRVHIRPVEGLPLLHVEEPTLSGIGWVAKNLMDRVAAALGLIILSPVLLAIGIAIKINDPKGPVIFRQRRLGLQSRNFKVWKFRTMYVDAEARLATLVDQNESDGLLFKIKDDPRVTPIGRWLRKTSMDELPQLVNILKGEMSLVGPRPLPAEDGDFLGDVRRRMLVRPGLTGLWQVSGRSDMSWDDAVRLDLYYVDNWSLLLDLRTLWRTVGVVVARRGAY
ncbi:sugar transferase [Longispora albida]|uniref:sugar transferase n=1 Tax=Longispora albida TaxID=203523 RepID=UPI0003681F8D|nr:sugar transferase [Longispora albida]